MITANPHSAPAYLYAPEPYPSTIHYSVSARQLRRGLIGLAQRHFVARPEERLGLLAPSAKARRRCRDDMRRSCCTDVVVRQCAGGRCDEPDTIQRGEHFQDYSGHRKGQKPLDWRASMAACVVPWGEVIRDLSRSTLWSLATAILEAPLMV